MTDNLIFTGIKHSGKTTFARLLSEEFSLPFGDGDELALPLLGGLTVREYYRTYGKEAFQEKETEGVRAFLSLHPECVLSLGGGASDNPPLMETAKAHGRIIYLSRPEEVLLPMILSHGVPAFLDPKDTAGSFHTIYTRRDRIYRDWADLTVELGAYGDLEETKAFLLRTLKENGYVR